MIPPQTALDTQTSTRPHILSHLFGIGGISRHIREAREDKERDAHASIAYDNPSQPVNEVPASVVYGKEPLSVRTIAVDRSRWSGPCACSGGSAFSQTRASGFGRD